MRKFLLMALFAITSSLAFAQELGVQAVYGTDLEVLRAEQCSTNE